MKKKRNEKRRPTDEEMSRADDVKLKRYITKSALQWAERDPEVKHQMVAQTFGYKLPDQAEKRRQELVAYIDEIAIQRLKEDPKLARIVVDARLRQVTEEMGLQIEGEEWRRKPLTMDDLIVQFKKFNEIKELVGIKKPGFWNDITDPQVITSFLAMIREVFMKEQPPAENRGIVLVQENGEERLITEEEYRELKAQAQSKSLGNVELTASNSRPEGNAATSESETSNKAEGGDGGTGTVDSGD